MIKCLSYFFAVLGVEAEGENTNSNTKGKTKMKICLIEKE